MMADDTRIHQAGTIRNCTPGQAGEHGADSAMAQLLLASSMAQRDMELEESAHTRPQATDDTLLPESPQPSTWQSFDDRRSPIQSNHVPVSPTQSCNPDGHVMSPKHEPKRENVQEFLRSPRQYDSMDGMEHGDDAATYSLPDSSPENLSADSLRDSPNKVYHCRLCSFSTGTYTQLQLHMPKHGGVKALKCPMCDYSTNDKSNFRRHRRLHMGNNPVSVFKCGKCSFSTIMIRKFREHCSQVHNDDLNNVPYAHQSHATFPAQTYTDGLERHFTLNPALDLQHTSHLSAPPHGNFSASNALHSLLTGIHPAPPIYRRQTYPAQGFNQYNNYLPPMQHSTEENHMASNYLRSIVSSIMNTHPPPRIPPSSTITSSGYYLSSATHDRHMTTATQSSMMSDISSRVKVKEEPPERDNTPDVSSSALPNQIPSVTGTSNTLSLNPYPRSHSASSDHPHSADTNAASQSVDVVRTNSNDSAQSSQQEARSSVDNMVNTTVKSELVSIGIQCSVPRMKMETDINRNHSMFNSSVDQGVQCELISAGARRTNRSCSLGSEESEQQASRCVHCGVTFDDEVLYSIHIGCHSHTDPFVCNVCGKQCGNKYGFYSHIMRGHHY